ncbi:transcriptional regulator [Streptomyces sp. AJS327]|uniref:helix-turn-helix domain-containing protein n=1 Tax=Streptomyces sp. AJS327 TaxID=2545265 RepID=UPI0015DFF65F|nr:helix-turn-helix transcriptional regulator [Streptomyces sp. AJS327]MBA0050183.1 transcriptional regulator [Streptomyces sp. AJS327]
MGAKPRDLTPDRSARHLFGAKLRMFRARAGMSLEGLSHVVNVSKSHLSRIETAEYMPPPELPAKLDEVFGTDGIFEELYSLARREVHPDQYRRRMELEARATDISFYAGQLVPGLLQTEEYARALFRAHNPRATEDEIDQLAAARASRQELLHREPRTYISVILDEAVLMRSFGGPTVMQEQLKVLTENVDTGTTLIQLLPFSHGGHALAGGSLDLLTLENGSVVAYEEGISSGHLLEDTEAVMARGRAYDRLRAHALSPTDTAAHIHGVMRGLQT